MPDGTTYLNCNSNEYGLSRIKQTESRFRLNGPHRQSDSVCRAGAHAAQSVLHCLRVVLAHTRSSISEQSAWFIANLPWATNLNERRLRQTAQQQGRQAQPCAAVRRCAQPCAAMRSHAQLCAAMCAAVRLALV